MENIPDEVLSDNLETAMDRRREMERFWGTMCLADELRTKMPLVSNWFRDVVASFGLVSAGSYYVQRTFASGRCS